MKVALFNDTAVFPHLGCQAVSNAHARMLGRAGHEISERVFSDWQPGFRVSDERTSIDQLLKDEDVRKRIESVDAVVVNGEGTIHDGAGLHLLAVLGAAQRLGKPTLLVNSVYERTTAFEDVIKRLDDFTVRDEASADYARSRGLKCRVVLDSSLEAKFSANPLLDLSSYRFAMSDWHRSRSRDVGMAIKKLENKARKDSFFVPFERPDAGVMWDRMVATIATARIFISARHHGIYFAIKGRTPFVPMPSNTGKISGLLRSLKVEMPLPTSFAGIEESMRWAGRNPDVYLKIFDRIAESGDLTTFEHLGRGDTDRSALEVERLRSDIQRAAGSRFLNGEWMTERLSLTFGEYRRQPKSAFRQLISRSR